MKLKRRKKYRLKKKVVNYLFLMVISILLIIMQQTKLLRPLFKHCEEKYLKKLYVSNSTNLKSKMVSEVFKDVDLIIGEEKSNVTTRNSDNVFKVKEDKDNIPIVYLYNTHQTEKYLYEDFLNYNPTVMTATSYLKEKLSEKNIESIMETKSISKVLSENNWKYGYSYKVSRMFIDEMTKDYPSVKYLFDIHRDSGSHEHTTLCIDNNCYAKVLFLVGLENPNYKENQEYAEKLSKKVNEKLNGLSKGILQKQGKNVNGVYNQDFSNRTILIEVGGENNTIEEVYKTIDILSEVIEEFIKEDLI